MITAHSTAAADGAAADDVIEEDAAEEADGAGRDEDGQPLADGTAHFAVLAIAVSPSGCAAPPLQRSCLVSLSLSSCGQLSSFSMRSSSLMRCLLARGCRRTIAAAVEGEDEVLMLHAVLRRGRNCGLPKGVLSVAQRLAMSDLRQPFAVAFQPNGRLWVAGMAALADADNRCMVLGAADRVVGDAADADSPEVMPQYVSCYCHGLPPSDVSSPWSEVCRYLMRTREWLLLQRCLPW